MLNTLQKIDLYFVSARDSKKLTSAITTKLNPNTLYGRKNPH